ncbi:hypothetical protein DSECCO2_570080 [anaerobic digester metagenome]
MNTFSLPVFFSLTAIRSPTLQDLTSLIFNDRMSCTLSPELIPMMKSNRSRGLSLKSFLMLLMFFKSMIGSTFMANFLQCSISFSRLVKPYIQNRGMARRPKANGLIWLESKDFLWPPASMYVSTSNRTLAYDSISVFSCSKLLKERQGRAE